MACPSDIVPGVVLVLDLLPLGAPQCEMPQTLSPLESINAQLGVTLVINVRGSRCHAGIGELNYMLYRVQQGLAVNGEFPSLPCRQDSRVIWEVAGYSARRQSSGAAAEADACRRQLPRSRWLRQRQARP